eukprot:TRINITY_DN10464_c0_g1_i2.p1 TRINITY_DN10464_c0_g1~~TRINITY_DN10464_c0_g1_i2.p1  ORF type:complete len:207 (+),score=47.73 TRINITY_DN10464_c0_g1_i2:65-622(+)
MGAHASTTPSPLQHEWPSGLGEEEWCAGDDYSSSGDEAGEGMTIPSSLLAADVSYWRQRGDLARQAMLDAQRAASFAEQRLAAAEQLAGAAAKQDAALARGTELICQQLREPGVLQLVRPSFVLCTSRPAAARQCRSPTLFRREAAQAAPRPAGESGRSRGRCGGRVRGRLIVRAQHPAHPARAL